MGTIIKRHLAARLGRDPASIFHVAIMPCYDKKLEASRDDFNVPGAACLPDTCDCLPNRGGRCCHRALAGARVTD